MLIAGEVGAVRVDCSDFTWNLERVRGLALQVAGGELGVEEGGMGGVSGSASQAIVIRDKSRFNCSGVWACSGLDNLAPTGTVARLFT